MSASDGRDGGRVYAVGGAKGGVGKTTTLLNLAAMLATTGRSTVAVDADLASASLTHYLDLPGDPTLHDVLAGRADIGPAVRDTPGRFDLVPGGTSVPAYAGADTDRLQPAIETLRGRYDVVLLDVGPGLSQDTAVPLGLADRVLLVTTPDPASLAATEKTRAVVEGLDGPAVEGVVVTRTTTAGAVAAADRLGVPLLAGIPTDEAVPASIERGVPLVRTDPESPAGSAYLGVARDGGQRADEDTRIG